MTKAELISQVAKTTGVDKADVLSVVKEYINVVKTSLEAGENVYLRGFGSFIVKKRAEKKARNISKNTTITIPEHNIPAFKPARVFLQAVSNAKKKSAKKKK
jgi:DNA-binding protein HU-beta